MSNPVTNAASEIDPHLPLYRFVFVHEIALTIPVYDPLVNPGSGQPNPLNKGETIENRVKATPFTIDRRITNTMVKNTDGRLTLEQINEAQKLAVLRLVSTLPEYVQPFVRINDAPLLSINPLGALSAFEFEAKSQVVSPIPEVATDAAQEALQNASQEASE